MFRILFATRVKRDFSKIDTKFKKIILEKLEDLCENPFPKGKKYKKLNNSRYFRFRMGNYRALYEVQGDLIIIYTIQHRKDIYKNI